MRASWQMRESYANKTHSPYQKAARWGQIAWLPASLEGQGLVCGRPGVRAQNVMQQTPSERIVSHAWVRDAGHLRQLFSEYVDIYRNVCVYKYIYICIYI